jgi:hypothetical protein
MLALSQGYFHPARLRPPHARLCFLWDRQLPSGQAFKLRVSCKRLSEHILLSSSELSAAYYEVPSFR